MSGESRQGPRCHSPSLLRETRVHKGVGPLALMEQSIRLKLMKEGEPECVIARGMNKGQVSLPVLISSPPRKQRGTLEKKNQFK